MSITSNKFEEKINNNQQIEIIKDPKKSETAWFNIQTIIFLWKKFLHIRRYVDAILVRLIFMAIPSYYIYILYCIYNSPLYFMMFSYYIVIILDGAYVLWKRAGRDYYWYWIYLY